MINLSRTLSAAFMLAVGLAACSSCKNNAGLVTPNPPVVTDQGDCAAACENLQRLHCSEGDPVDMGMSCHTAADCTKNGAPDPLQECVAGKCEVSCVNFCIDTENQGVWLDPACVKSIDSCDKVESCPLPSKPKPSCEGPACNLPGNR